MKKIEIIKTPDEVRQRIRDLGKEISRAFGADGVTVTTPEELDKALDVAFATDGPYLVECIIDKDEFVLPMLPPGGSMDDIIVKVGD